MTKRKKEPGLTEITAELVDGCKRLTCDDLKERGESMEDAYIGNGLMMESIEMLKRIRAMLDVYSAHATIRYVQGETVPTSEMTQLAILLSSGVLQMEPMLKTLADSTGISLDRLNEQVAEVTMKDDYQTRMEQVSDFLISQKTDSRMRS